MKIGDKVKVIRVSTDLPHDKSFIGEHGVIIHILNHVPSYNIRVKLRTDTTWFSKNELELIPQDSDFRLNPNYYVINLIKLGEEEFARHYSEEILGLTKEYINKGIDLLNARDGLKSIIEENNL